MKNSDPKVVSFGYATRSWSRLDADVLEQELRRSNPVFDSEAAELRGIKMAAELVKRARIDAGLSQSEVATRTGSHQPTLSSFETLSIIDTPIDGNGPSLGYIIRIANACGYELEMSLKKKE